MSQTQKNIAIGLLLFVVGFGGGRATADCPDPVTDCPVVIDQGVLDQYCPECQECPVVETPVCPEPTPVSPCPPPTMHHPVEIRVAPAVTYKIPEYRHYLTPAVGDDLESVALTYRYNWKYSARFQPVIGVLWTDEESSSPYDPPYRTFRNWNPPTTESSSGAWQVLLGVQVGFM